MLSASRTRRWSRTWVVMRAVTSIGLPRAAGIADGIIAACRPCRPTAPSGPRPDDARAHPRPRWPPRRLHRRVDRDGRRGADDPDARVLRRHRPPDRDLERHRRQPADEARGGRGPRPSRYGPPRAGRLAVPRERPGGVPGRVVRWPDAAGCRDGGDPQGPARCRAPRRDRWSGRPGRCSRCGAGTSRSAKARPRRSDPISWSSLCRSWSSVRSPGSWSASRRSVPARSSSWSCCSCIRRSRPRRSSARTSRRRSRSWRPRPPATCCSAASRS